MPYKYIGRTHDFKGKTVWEIIGNLKNFGVGRVISRNMLQRYKEPTYLKILKVEALPNVAPDYDVSIPLSFEYQSKIFIYIRPIITCRLKGKQ